MSATELLPCPFCGGKAELWRAHPHPDRAAWIACMGKCSVLVSKEHKTDAEAISAWNTRADIPAARITELKAEVARLRDAGQAVVNEFPVAAGTSKGIPPDECGYGSIYRLRLALDTTP